MRFVKTSTYKKNKNTLKNWFSTDDRRYSSTIVDLNEVNESFPLVKYIVSVIAFYSMNLKQYNDFRMKPYRTSQNKARVGHQNN